MAYLLGQLSWSIVVLVDTNTQSDQHHQDDSQRISRSWHTRHLVAAVVTLAVFAAFTCHLLDQVTTATGPAIDFTFDLLVWVALAIYLIRRRLTRP